MQVEGRVAVVTGAAGGIGAALAEALVEAGAHVVVSDVDGERLAATAERIGAVAVAGDAASEEVIAAMVASAEEHFGPVDIFFANAGVGDGSGLAATDEQWQLALDVNLLA
ncbi:MAG: dehydrogenase, partial [Kytococcus sp.]|nr:dehydrogenase [Kytococcus sp.]